MHEYNLARKHMKRNILKSIIAAALLASASLASRFNTNASAPHIVQAPAPTRKGRGYRTGIKGMASSNNTRYGAGLKNHFDSKRGVRA